MKAMILAAGLGTRLRPVTDTTPKALVRVGGKPMLQIVAERLIAAGVTEIIVNVHHHAGQMYSYIDSLTYPGITFHISDERDRLLDTGGGLLHARSWLDGSQDFFLYNIDILSAINLSRLYQAHADHLPLATLAVSDRPTSRYLLWDGDELAGWENTETGAQIFCRPGPDLPTKRNAHASISKTHPFRRKAFTGIAVISPAIFDLMEERGAFSIKDVYLRLAKEWPIRCFEHECQSWFDIGTPEKLAHARRHFRQFDNH
jgi:N-acetyl-alpha-D-muramate 1-phosphate uridylyltransferase